MPKPPKRPRDMMQLAKLVGEMATHEREEETVLAPDEAAVKRGKARAESLTPGKRKAIAKKAAEARWKKPKA
jgi:hypothetical protein